MAAATREYKKDSLKSHAEVGKTIIKNRKSRVERELNGRRHKGKYNVKHELSLQ